MRILFFVFSFFCFTHPNSIEIKKIFISGSAQGTTYHITYYANDSVVTKFQIDSIFNKIDSSLSLYKPYSLVNQFNNSSEGLIADKYLKEVVNKGIEICRITRGIFDITVYPYTEAWGFGTKKIDSTPSAKTIQQLYSCVGSAKLYWSGNKLRKQKSCVKLDPNGIAQGYSVDLIADFLSANDINNYLVELGGEIRVKGRKQPDNLPMKIAIEVPGEDKWDISLSQKTISIEEGAITTSGSYRKFYESKGKRVSHIIDARTGFPVQNELISVTVFAENAITADAYDNALMVMGLKQALAFTEKRKDIAAHFIYRKKDGSIADTASSRFRLLLQL